MSKRQRNKKSFQTGDGFANLTSRLGYSPQVVSNGLSNGYYQFNLMTRNRQQLEAGYRGSWMVGQIVDSIAEDMTRARIELRHTGEPKESAEIERELVRKGVWGDLTDTIKWSRLYGGALAVIMIEGQDLSTPLDMDTVAKGQFKGLLSYDRWQLLPSTSDLIGPSEGPEAGLPRFYQVVTYINNQEELTGVKIHYSRVIRMIGVQLPFYQSITETYWGESIVERLYDRLISFDTATMGVANLIDRAYLRTIGVDGLREILSAGGKAEESLISMFDYMRLLQNNEGLTLTDKNDTFQTNTYSFAGVSDVILQFGQQLSGASGIPLVRLFGQSPSGMSATGESDMRIYYDNILSRQESTLREGLQRIINVAYRSLYAKPLPSDTTFDFAPLWQMSATDKATISLNSTTAIMAAYSGGVINQATALRELKQSGETTGAYTNITDEEIADAENEPPMPSVETQPAEAEPQADKKTWGDKLIEWMK